MKRSLVVAAVVCSFVLSFSVAPAVSGCRGPEFHSSHDKPTGHRYLCRAKLLSSTVVSESAGLGQIELKKGIGAVLQRDEGIVAMLNMSDPARPKVVGRFDDGAQQSFDGDLVFSHDARFLFYARQTHQFSGDGVHVLDVSDPASPTETFYQASGGTLRIAYHFDGTEEWVVFLDAVDGLVVSRFVRESGSLVEVFRDPEPALRKVGGPASAGVWIDKKDPASEAPLLYVSTGGSGLQIYDFSTPATPVELGSWNETGLAEIRVRRTATKRTVYAATEYWFERSVKPEVVVLDATNLDTVKKVRSLSLRLPAEDMWRVQGMTWANRRLLVAHSHAGLIGFSARGRIAARALIGGKQHEAAEPPPTEQMGLRTSAYAMDVAKKRRFLYLTDAATGTLHVLRLLRT